MHTFYRQEREEIFAAPEIYFHYAWTFRNLRLTPSVLCC